jgi:hypothetical protein
MRVCRQMAVLSETGECGRAAGGEIRRAKRPLN